MMRLLYVASLAAPVLAAFRCPDWPLPKPWGPTKGTLNANDVCEYFNIRYASPPTGKLRFQAPEYPPNQKSNLQIPGPDPSCFQANDVKCLGPKGPLDDFPGNTSSCFPQYYGTQSEDCLFLDVYVPKQVFEKTKIAPVLVWFYGGAYLYGSKTQYNPTILPFYDGSGLVGAAPKINDGEDSVIYVRGNYRLGAFGWLAGAYMGQHGQPNAGLLDQRAVLQFVHDHIKDIKGNSSAVSVWGESAGASSIMHHLVMPENIKQPLFQRAILQSPAFQWLWARNGDLNSTFTDFAKATAKYAKCQKADMACLQSADTMSLQKANQRIFQRKACDGIIPIGPSVDGKIIKTLAPVGLGAGNLMPIESLIVSHVDLEVPYVNSTEESTSVPLPIRNDSRNASTFDLFLENVFAGNAYTNVRESIKKQYPTTGYSDQIARSAAMITDSSFTCNTRFIIDSYIKAKSKVYAMNYAFGAKANASTHASDLLPLFYNEFIPKTDYKPLALCIKNTTDFGELMEAEFFASFVGGVIGPEVKKYFLDHAIWGDPNHNKGVIWPLATNENACSDNALGKCVGNCMRIADLESLPGLDKQTPSKTCDIWMRMALDITKISEKSANEELLSSIPEQLTLNEEL